MSGEAFDLALRLMDRQVVGPEGQLVGNVDDVALEADGASVRVTGLLQGPSALGPRLPRWIGQRAVDIWKRLSHPASDEPGLVPLADVVSIGSEVTVDDVTASRLEDSAGLETWLRQHVISRIPGARHEPGSEAEHSARGSAGPVQPAPPGTLRLSTLLGASAEWSDGRPAGRVVRVLSTPLTADGTIPATGIELTELLLGPRSLWLLVRHDEPGHRTGPPILGPLLHRISPTEQTVSFRDVASIDWSQRRVVVRA